MNFNDLLGLLGDFCLYFSSIGFLVRLCGETKSGGFYMAVYLLCAAAFLLCRKLKGPLRFAPMLLMLPAFLAAESIAAWILPIPLCILLALRAYKDDWQAEYGRTKDMLKTGFIACCILLVFLILSEYMEKYSRTAMPFFIGWLLICVLQLRLLRSCQSSEMGAGFKLMNCLIVLLVAALGLLFSSELFVNAVKAAFSALHTYVVGPLLFALLCVIAAIPALVSYLIALLLSMLRNEETEMPELDLSGSAQQLFGETEFVQSPDWLKNAAIAIGIVLFVVLCFFLIHKLLGNKSRENSTSGISRESTGLSGAGKKRRAAGGNTASDTVRSCYKRYLELCGKNRIDVDGSIASDEICRKSQYYAKSDDPEKLRQLWLPARYSDSASGSEDAKTAKALLKNIKRSFAEKDRP